MIEYDIDAVHGTYGIHCHLKFIRSKAVLALFPGNIGLDEDIGGNIVTD